MEIENELKEIKELLLIMYAKMNGSDSVQGIHHAEVRFKKLQDAVDEHNKNPQPPKAPKFWIVGQRD